MEEKLPLILYHPPLSQHSVVALNFWQAQRLMSAVWKKPEPVVCSRFARGLSGRYQPVPVDAVGKSDGKEKVKAFQFGASLLQ
ncbi:hypothetical protein NQZ68_033968 [Dissostichus eleginoides]|nr:hypothetical protein NQZ68_033968 [Dissostichus eleginoides]